MAGQRPCGGPAFDRREFIGATMATAALGAGSLVPVGPVAAAIGVPERLDDWSIDDQWMGYPRYAEMTGHGRPRPVEPQAPVHPADAPFVPY